ncbi:MAG: hypothetical protein M3501_08075, partial [Actinomycetota bacterium]|nr:hypothetical protein [Actinomycetota bacterium]
MAVLNTSDGLRHIDHHGGVPEIPPLPPPTPTRATFLRPRGLADRGAAAGLRRCRRRVPPPLRHAVAVAVDAEGKLLAARHRLGHRDLSTTLRHDGWAGLSTAPHSVSISTPCPT